MRLYESGIFQSHLELEVDKSERYKYPFSVIAVTTSEESNKQQELLASIIDAQLRKTDLVTLSEQGVYLILLNATEKVEAEGYLERLTNKAVVENGLSLRTSVESYRVGDEPIDILLRLYMKLR